jgi:uncharacterized membrane protein
MNEYLVIKWAHILSATFLFGTGLGSAFYKWMTDRTGVLPAIVQTNRLVVLADWIFTTPTIVIQPISGIWLLMLMGSPLDQGWILLAILLYFLAGACWLPVVWLQIRMRDLAVEAYKSNQPLNNKYQEYSRIWFWLGVPAFIAMIVIYFLMIYKPSINF